MENKILLNLCKNTNLLIFKKLKNFVEECSINI